LLIINEDDGWRRVAHGVWEGVQPIDKHKSAAQEEAGILETDYDDTHRRVGDGISGRALLLPPSWEVINSELYAIYAYLRRRVEVMEATGATQRCLILSYCKAALEGIEWEYRGQTPHNADRRTLLTAIPAQLTALRRKEGYAIFLWTPGHGGVVPNAVADATAKTYLAADHDRLIARDLAKRETRAPPAVRIRASRHRGPA